MTLLQPQVCHANILLDSLYINGIALDLSPTGTGKTYVAVWLAKQLNCPVIIICPNTVQDVWLNLCTDAGIPNPLIINFELLVRGNTKYLNYDLNMFHRDNRWWESKGLILNFPKDAVIIVDEMHKCRGQKSLSMELILAITNAGYKCIGCSATLATSVIDMKSTGYLAKLHDGENFKNWCFDHGATYNEYGTLSWDGDQTAAKDGMRTIHNNIFAERKIASRMNRADFGDIFPSNRLIPRIFNLGSNTGKLQAVYDTMQYELSLLDSRSAKYKDHVFAIMIEARRKSELLKVPTIVEWIENMYDEGISPVVFLNFNDSIDAVLQRLQKKKFNNKIGVLRGGMNRIDRVADIADFQNDIKRIFIANKKAGNLGISLHDLHGKFSRASLINPSWSAIDFIQAIGRIWRAKGVSHCDQTFLYADVPIEVNMANRLNARIDNLDCLNDGDVDYTVVLTA
jgi:hypothetical protein